MAVRGLNPAFPQTNGSRDGSSFPVGIEFRDGRTREEREPSGSLRWGIGWVNLADRRHFPATFPNGRLPEASIHRHHFPEDQLFLVDGIDCMGPDTAALARDCLTDANRLRRGGTIALDVWAWETIGMAAAAFPNFVSHPVMAVMLRADGTRHVRDVEDPSPWAGSAAFEVPVEALSLRWR